MKDDELTVPPTKDQRNDAVIEKALKSTKNELEGTWKRTNCVILGNRGGGRLSKGSAVRKNEEEVSQGKKRHVRPCVDRKGFDQAAGSTQKKKKQQKKHQPKKQTYSKKKKKNKKKKTPHQRSPQYHRKTSLISHWQRSRLGSPYGVGR